jgi:HAD superfamily hydrolase (TIGR01549 family)
MKTLVCDFARVLLLPKNQHFVGSVDTQVENNQTSFWSQFEWNEELIECIASLQGIKKYVFTSGTSYQVPEIHTRLLTIFEKVFTTTEIDYLKSNPNAFVVLSYKLGVEAKDILFIDDSLENVLAARQAGCEAIHFKKTSDVVSAIRNWVSPV